jgi:hypothetical protein
MLHAVNDYGTSKKIIIKFLTALILTDFKKYQLETDDFSIHTKW